jgi:ribose 1,5-bisphosphokinase
MSGGKASAWPEMTVHHAIAPGVFIAVVGPSGAGKDSLISAARRHFGASRGVVFARRVITRAPDAHEDHEPVTPLQFRIMRARGAFVLSWSANGLDYGLPATLSDDLGRSTVVVANVSRDVLPAVRQTFARSLVIHVTASVETLSRRLAARGREDEAQRGARLARSLLREQAVEADIRIENNGELADAQRSFIEILNIYQAPLTAREDLA